MQENTTNNQLKESYLTDQSDEIVTPLAGELKQEELYTVLEYYTAMYKEIKLRIINLFDVEFYDYVMNKLTWEEYENSCPELRNIKVVLSLLNNQILCNMLCSNEL